jgi:hypothetical protein
MAGAVELGRPQARRAPNLKHKSQAQVASKGDAIAADASHPRARGSKIGFRNPPAALCNDAAKRFRDVAKMV